MHSPVPRLVTSPVKTLQPLQTNFLGQLYIQGSLRSLLCTNGNCADNFIDLLSIKIKRDTHYSEKSNMPNWIESKNRRSVKQLDVPVRQSYKRSSRGIHIVKNNWLLAYKLDTVTSNVRKTVTTSLFNWDVGRSHHGHRVTFSEYAQLTEDQRKFLMRRIMPTYRLWPQVRPNYTKWLIIGLNSFIPLFNSFD